jgi:hypothetical protein
LSRLPQFLAGFAVSALCSDQSFVHRSSPGVHRNPRGCASGCASNVGGR